MLKLGLKSKLIFGCPINISPRSLSRSVVQSSNGFNITHSSRHICHSSEVSASQPSSDKAIVALIASSSSTKRSNIFKVEFHLVATSCSTFFGVWTNIFFLINCQALCSFYALFIMRDNCFEFVYQMPYLLVCTCFHSTVFHDEVQSVCVTTHVLVPHLFHCTFHVTGIVCNYYQNLVFKIPVRDYPQQGIFNVGGMRPQKRGTV